MAGGVHQKRDAWKQMEMESFSYKTKLGILKKLGDQHAPCIEKGGKSQGTLIDSKIFLSLLKPSQTKILVAQIHSLFNTSVMFEDFEGRNLHH